MAGNVRSRVVRSFAPSRCGPPEPSHVMIPLCTQTQSPAPSIHQSDESVVSQPASFRLALWLVPHQGFIVPRMCGWIFFHSSRMHSRCSRGCSPLLFSHVLWKGFSPSIHGVYGWFPSRWIVSHRRRQPMAVQNESTEFRFPGWSSSFALRRCHAWTGMEGTSVPSLGRSIRSCSDGGGDLQRRGWVGDPLDGSRSIPILLTYRSEVFPILPSIHSRCDRRHLNPARTWWIEWWAVAAMTPRTRSLQPICVCEGSSASFQHPPPFLALQTTLPPGFEPGLPTLRSARSGSENSRRTSTPPSPPPLTPSHPPLTHRPTRTPPGGTPTAAAGGDSSRPTRSHP